MTHDSWPTRAPQPYLPCGGTVGMAVWPNILTALMHMIRRLKERVGRWHRHRQTLRALSKLEAHMLKDIGLPGGPMR